MLTSSPAGRAQFARVITTGRVRSWCAYERVSNATRTKNHRPTRIVRSVGDQCRGFNARETDTAGGGHFRFAYDSSAFAILSRSASSEDVVIIFRIRDDIFVRCPSSPSILYIFLRGRPPPRGDFFTTRSFG